MSFGHKENPRGLKTARGDSLAGRNGFVWKAFALAISAGNIKAGRPPAVFDRNDGCRLLGRTI